MEYPKKQQQQASTSTSMKDSDQSSSSSENEEDDDDDDELQELASMNNNKAMNEEKMMSGSDHNVDKKADEFIAKFREQIRLQRIASIRTKTTTTQAKTKPDLPPVRNDGTREAKEYTTTFESKRKNNCNS
ncbi:putative homeobox-leucine zipper protein HAT4-like protein [Tanacetum coccineum]